MSKGGQIAYKDFLPSRTALFAGMLPLDEAVWSANQWITEQSATVINVETVAIDIFLTPTSYPRVWHTSFVRVWYRPEGPIPGPDLPPS